MPGRKFTAGSGYRYGFNGKERDNDVEGEGNSYDFGARIQDPRLGRWFSVDPLEKKYPGFSPYCFAINSPLITVDFDGRDIIIVTSNGAFRLGKQTLLKTATGKALWNKFAKSKSVDIYIAVGAIPVSDGAGAETLFSIAGTTMIKNDKILVDPKDKVRSEFNVFNGTDVKRSKGKKIGLIIFNDKVYSDNYADIVAYWKKLNNPGEFEYELAESIFHEMKAHVDLKGAADEHKAYGKSTMGVFRNDLLPAKGTPAEKIKEELHEQYLKGFIDDPRTTKPPADKQTLTNQTTQA